jgi:GNAT superfamily N-acetyltransferase
MTIEESMMIRLCQEKDIREMCDIINEAAKAYDGVIADDCYHEPYMSEEELRREMKRVMFYGWEDDGSLVGVMGIEPVKDVTLIRHSYVLPEYQGRGIGKALLKHLIKMTRTRRLLVGTWADASWAISFYRMQGFNLMPDKDRLLNDYWDIPQRQIETSIVMGIETGRK